MKNALLKELVIRILFSAVLLLIGYFTSGVTQLGFYIVSALSAAVIPLGMWQSYWEAKRSMRVKKCFDDFNKAIVKATNRMGSNTSLEIDRKPTTPPVEYGQGSLIRKG